MIERIWICFLLMAPCLALGSEKEANDFMKEIETINMVI